jgi:uncharacterized protein (DUF2062 family)
MSVGRDASDCQTFHAEFAPLRIHRIAASVSSFVPASVTTLPTPSFWQRRVVAPLRVQLTQGVTPDRLALTIAVGVACSVLPFLGFTTLLNVGAGLWLRLNHPILQAVNYVLGGVQLALILIYVRVGEIIWRAPHLPLSLTQLTADFRANPGGFFARFAWTGVHAGTAWLLSVPAIVAVIYYSLRPVMRKFATRSAAGN